MSDDAVAALLVVLDTNVVLDLLVFDDPGAQELKAGLARGALRWITTSAMREELERVLAYPQLASQLAGRGLDPGAVLAAFDGQVSLVAAPPRCAVACSDSDDQQFIDLAVQHRCLLLSKDAAVLSLKKRLALFGVSARAALAAAV